MSNQYKHRVTNRTARNIWVNRGSWSSWEIPPETSLDIPAPTNVKCGVWGKYNQKDELMGEIWIPRDGQATVYNRWNWDIRPSKSADEQFPVALSEAVDIQDDTPDVPSEIEPKTESSYGVINSTGRNIEVKDGSWKSGVIVPKEHRKIVAAADVNVTIWGKSGEPPHQKDEDMGQLWIPRRGQVTVHDRWNWDIRPEFVRGPGKQSPVALNDRVADYERSSLAIRWKKDLAGQVEGGGDHIKVVFKSEDRGYIKLNDDKEWTIKEFHLHAPAEHPIQGKFAPIELHIVHQNLKDETLAVLGITFEASADLSAERCGFFDALSERLTALKAGQVVDMPVKPYDLLPVDHSQYYYYDGSLTTGKTPPPYQEGVSWFVLLHPKLLPASQIEEYRKNYSGTARAIQPLNFRDLFRNF